MSVDVLALDVNCLPWIRDVNRCEFRGHEGPIARTPLNSWVYLTGQFEYTERRNRCKNAKSTLKSTWVHSNFEWRNSPLKSPLNSIKWWINCFYHMKQRKCASKSSN